MENNNGGKPKEQPMDITAELIKLYRDDPISHNVIQYLLAKYKIIPVNALESIRQHREEILLNIVLCYKKMWEMRIKKMTDTIHMRKTPKTIIIGMEDKDESDQGKGKEDRTENNSIEGDHTRGAGQKENDKGSSQES